MTDLPTLLNIFSIWMTSLNDFWVAINSPVINFIARFDFFAGPAISSGLILLGLGDFSILELILGGGLLFYIVYQLAIWVFNLVT